MILYPKITESTSDGVKYQVYTQQNQRGSIQILTLDRNNDLYPQ